jgi:hypothetical protein
MQYTHIDVFICIYLHTSMHIITHSLYSKAGVVINVAKLIKLNNKAARALFCKMKSNPKHY